VHAEDGSGYLILADAKGDVRLLDAADGSELSRVNLGWNLEASPAVFGNRVVIAERGNRIFGLELR
jgi:hypothetical protein